MVFTWITPNNKCRNISITIDKIYLGIKDDDIRIKDNEYSKMINKSSIPATNTINNNSINNDYYVINTPVISESVYREIIQYLSIINIVNNNNNINIDNFNYLKFNKQTKSLKKVYKKTLYRFSLTICPVCFYSNCIDCTKKRYQNYMKYYYNVMKENHKKITVPTTTKGIVFPRYIKCFKCHNIFSTHRNCKLFKCLGYQCNICEKKYSQIYSEFLIYNNNNDNKNYLNNLPLRNILNIHYGDITTTLSRKKRMQYIYEKFLTPEIKKQINYDYNTLYYHLRVRKENSGEIVIVPPLAFFSDMNKPTSFYLKLLDNNNNNHLDIKSSYGSVNSRSSGGRNSMFRDVCLVKRYVGSARAVIVPRQFLLPHECILPTSIYKALNFPKHVLLHRYPTLDIRSMTYHTVIGHWSYPSIAISTSIVSGNNADFDGDCIHIVPATNIMSQAELIFLCHPKYNMIVQKNQLKINFDHDEIETIYSHLGLNRHQIHNFIYSLATKKSSQLAYKIFCYLKRYCEWVWTFQGGVSTITFNDFLEIINVYEKEKKDNDDDIYDRFTEYIFPNNISNSNGIKKLINSEASRFSVSHLFQIFGYINEDTKDEEGSGGFLKGLTKSSFIKMSYISRLAMLKDVAFHGYSSIKLTHCTKSFIVGYDNRVYTTDNILVGTNVEDIY